MKKITGIISIPKECVSNLVISLVAIAVFVCAAIIPGYLSSNALDQKISDARYKLEEHKNLQPFYQALRNAPPGSSAVLVAPGSARLKAADLDTAIMTIRNISGKAAMTIIDVRPDLSNASGHVQSVAVIVSLKGSFENFRSVLADLGALPYVENLEEISIQREPSGQVLGFNIKIILSVS